MYQQVQLNQSSKITSSIIKQKRGDNHKSYDLSPNGQNLFLSFFQYVKYKIICEIIFILKIKLKICNIYNVLWHINIYNNKGIVLEIN